MGKATGRLLHFLHIPADKVIEVLWILENSVVFVFFEDIKKA